MSLSQQCYSSLCRYAPGARSTNSVGTLVDAYQNYMNCSESVAVDKVSPASKRLINSINKYNSALERRGVPPAFSTSSDGSAFIWKEFGHSNKADLRRAQKFVYRRKIYLFIDRISHRNFEFLAAAAINGIEVDRKHVTVASKDGGVDFYAEIPIRGPSVHFASRDRSLRIVGSAKHYSGKVPVAHAREFSQVISDIRAKSVQYVSIVPTWFYESEGPISGFIASKEGLQSGAMEKCKYQGIVTSDIHSISHELSAMLLRDRGYGASVFSYLSSLLEEISK